MPSINFILSIDTRKSQKKFNLVEDQIEMRTKKIIDYIDFEYTIIDINIVSTQNPRLKCIQLFCSYSAAVAIAKLNEN